MSGKRFLVVDDDPALRGQLRTYLERKGHRVEAVGNGREALIRLDQAVYDAVLLDYMTSEIKINGLTVLRHVRQHYPSLPVMMMTHERCGHVATESFVALGARGCLFKPLAPQDLERIVTCL
jgi:CheY-like chemotaxis protein